jgi:hypothetical protein
MIKSPTFREKIIEAYKKNAVIIDADGREHHFHYGYEYVEIGGLKWATKNVGAKDRFDNGLYFQWGDTNGYTAESARNGEKWFDWADYPFYFNGKLTKYNGKDGKTVLDLEDDAARVNMGGSWRMPTKEEFEQLLNSTLSYWVVNYKGSGTNGLVCTDKTDKTKVLFFPANGYYGSNTPSFVGYYGYYWTRSCSISVVENVKTRGGILHFSRYGVNAPHLTLYVGSSIRGVIG